jgi:hypothetical protein
VALSPDQAVTRARELLDYHTSERTKLDRIRRYWKGRQRLPAVIPRSAPREVRVMAAIARVNICDIVVESLTQSLFVDGFRAEIVRDTQGEAVEDGQGGETFDENTAGWDSWQRNKLDRGQSRTHRAAVAYGTGYAVVTPGAVGGRSVPLVTTRSPRKLLAMYDENPDYPAYALERPRARGGPWRLYDDELVHRLWLQTGGSDGGAFMRRPDSSAPHGLDVCPVVRFSDVEDDDLDDEPASESVGWPGGITDGIVAGQVAPLVPLQDQIDLITFNLLVAQHYTAFRQRWAVGWLGSEELRMASAASQLWTFEDHPDDLKLGEFSQTELTGYIKSREASLRHAATLSQTPVHELIGELINLSAEALAAAEAGKDRKVDERKTGFGESWEQVFSLVGKLTGDTVPDDAEVVWRDTSARSFAQVVDGLGKLAQMLQIPPEALWERVPGVTQQDIRRWKALRREGDAFQSLEARLRRQAEGAIPPAPNGQPQQQTGNGLILPAAVR